MSFDIRSGFSSLNLPYNKKEEVKSEIIKSLANDGVIDSKEEKNILSKVKTEPEKKTIHETIGQLNIDSKSVLQKELKFNLDRINEVKTLLSSISPDSRLNLNKAKELNIEKTSLNDNNLEASENFVKKELSIGNNIKKLPDSFKTKTENTETSFIKDNSKSKKLSSNVEHIQYNSISNDKYKTIRLDIFDPTKVNYEIQSYQNNNQLSFDKLKNQNGFISAINGTTMATDPKVSNFNKTQGDILTTNQKGEKSLYQLKNNNSAANNRYSLVIKNDGNVDIIKGSLKIGSKPVTIIDQNKDFKIERSNTYKNTDNYKYSLGGGGLLFDDSNFKGQKNEKDFYKNFNENNDKSLVNNMRLEDKIVGRTVIGITSEGKVIHATFGEGTDSLKQNNKFGNTGFELYQSFKSMGVVKAFLLDGSGATGMGTNDPNIKTNPDINRGYGINSSFPVIKEK